jgi:hypothetical protein
MPPKRSDWSRRLPRTLVIPTVMTLRTLADARKLIQHLPEDRRARSTWRHVQEQLGQGADPADVAIALRLALILENVECRRTDQ